MGIFLNSFNPLCSTRRGRVASEKYSLPPFIDGSCRREPDLESEFPPITGICRKSKLLSRLAVGDIVIYITNKGENLGGIPHWRLVSILRVLEIAPTHQEAQKFYTERGIKTPNNLFVEGNEPYSLEKTHLRGSSGYSKREGRPSVEEWNAIYKVRSREEKRVAICEKMLTDLWEPISIMERDMLNIFGRVPCCQNPPSLTTENWEKLKAFIKTTKKINL